MSRFLNRGTQVVLDFAVLSLAYWLAFLFRYEFQLPHQAAKLLFFTWPYVVLFQYVMLSVHGVPRFAWRYVSIREAQWVVSAIAASTAVLVSLRLLMGLVGGYGQFLMIPLGVLAMNFVMASSGIVGVRVLRRIIAEGTERRQLACGPVEQVRTLLLGAGQGGVMISREIALRPDLGFKAVGFLDDDAHKVGTQVNGLRVLGSIDQIADIAAAHRVEHALIAIATASSKEMRRIALLCQDAGLETKIIPGLHEIVGGHVNLSRLRKVAIEDLLGREQVDLDDEAIASVVQDRVAMVTGAGGSIGSELCRQLCRYRPERLVLVEKSENSLFEIHRELLGGFPHIQLIPVLGDICDVPRMDRVFREHQPHTVFHAAAHKHVPMIEWNPGEAIKNNVIGTRVIADLADAHGVSEFVMISTDKAVNPSSVMGASKRVAEIYIQALSQRSETKFVAVRFGNVLGSAGSVVPIFKRQIADGGPVTVTHPDMRRYFMTIPEAAQLVLQAASMGDGGEIFILDMGEPVKIVDLARDLIRLSGLEPDEDIEIEFTGMRPGEKLYEELSVDAEEAANTKHPKIFVGRIQSQEWSAVVMGLGQLLAVADSDRVDEVRAALANLVPEFRAPRLITARVAAAEAM